MSTEKTVYLDFKGAMQILKQRGTDKEINQMTTAKEIGYTTVGMVKIGKEAPKAIKMVFKYLRDNDLKFEDLVKER